ncbi:hypothetical protein [Allosphingosinicella deserti]|uniref:Uncharacterized protein n=1 Tax=Allosphingosinicella deserti TaxID=2116704 RepID=A0A2P7QVI5_9SPHN|nr:hypothetical protein [Sphingomonas deserti]PSJ41963.1 hypothetical protein C7I55_06805 [Sphingomonas deserti]
MTLADADQVAPGYQVTLTLKVSDVAALWAAAAQRGLAAPGTNPADVFDVIGPREDPSLADCIAMLAGPVSVPGCSLDDLEIAEL